MSVSFYRTVVAPPIGDNYMAMIALTDIGFFAHYVTPSTTAHPCGQELKVANETMGEHVDLHKGFQQKTVFKRSSVNILLLRIFVRPAEPMPSRRYELTVRSCGCHE